MVEAMTVRVIALKPEQSQLDELEKKRQAG
jgi:hypothetical protein